MFLVLIFLDKYIVGEGGEGRWGSNHLQRKKKKKKHKHYEGCYYTWKYSTIYIVIYPIKNGFFSLNIWYDNYDSY